jgi:hypothetical protein
VGLLCFGEGLQGIGSGEGDRCCEVAVGFTDPCASRLADRAAPRRDVLRCARDLRSSSADGCLELGFSSSDLLLFAERLAEHSVERGVGLFDLAEAPKRVSGIDGSER